MTEVDKCPICETQHGLGRDADTPTDLCNQCAVNRFFLDDCREVEYRLEVKKRIEALQALFGDDYKDTLHRDMVEQMVRAEINMKRYERLISNDNEAPQTSNYLIAERNHWNKVADKLNMTIRSIRGDTKNIKHDFGDDFREYMAKVLGDEDEEKQEQKPEQPEG